MEAMQTGLYTEEELLAAEANGSSEGRSQLHVKPMRSVRVDGGMCRSDVLMQMQADITDTQIGGCCSAALLSIINTYMYSKYCKLLFS